jgi:hypothetical protein
MDRSGQYCVQRPFAGAACKRGPTRQRPGLKNVRAQKVRVKAAPLQCIGAIGTSHPLQLYLHGLGPAVTVIDG